MCVYLRLSCNSRLQKYLRFRSDEKSANEKRTGFFILNAFRPLSKTQEICVSTYSARSGRRRQRPSAASCLTSCSVMLKFDVFFGTLEHLLDVVVGAFNHEMIMALIFILASHIPVD